MKTGFEPGRPTCVITFWAVVLSAVCYAAGPQEGDFKALYDRQEWVRLRDAVQDTTSVPPLYRAAVLCSFNETEAAEQELLGILKSAPSTSDTLEAHGLLESIYWRAGQFRKVLKHFEQEVALGGAQRDKENTLELIRALSQFPEMAVTQRQKSSFHVWYKNDFVPLEINGKSYRGFLDTGANMSIISESAAKRLGLAVAEVSGTKMGDSTGNGLKVTKVAVADKLALGKIELRHVPFVVVGDQAPPFCYWRSSQRCLLGTQVIVACQTVCWKESFLGVTLELGAPGGPRKIRESNLYFHGTLPHVSAGFGKATLDLLLDTGSGSSHLYPRFAREFPEQVNGSGKKAMRKVEGFGGAAQKEVTVLPKLPLSLGGLDVTYYGLDVHLKGNETKGCHGMLGSNIMKGAREVIFDFNAMTFILR